MTWSDTPIDGQQSVSTNKPPINNAFTIIANNMDNDHFWDTRNDGGNANLRGRHQFVQMPKFEAGGNPANPTIGTNMDGVYYSKDKTATDAPDLQMPEPFFIASDGTRNQIEQLGFRAMVHFEVAAGVVTEKYVHNCSVVRDSIGLFTLTFDVEMPTDNYIFFGTALRSSGNPLSVGPQPGAKADMIKTTTLKFRTSSIVGGGVSDPIVVMLAVCGG